MARPWEQQRRSGRTTPVTALQGQGRGKLERVGFRRRVRGMARRCSGGGAGVAPVAAASMSSARLGNGSGHSERASNSQRREGESRESAGKSEREISGAPHRCKRRQGCGHVEGHTVAAHCLGGVNSSAWRARRHMVGHLAGVTVTMLGGRFGPVRVRTGPWALNKVC
jgi:hypothetical protein